LSYDAFNQEVIDMPHTRTTRRRPTLTILLIAGLSLAAACTGAEASRLPGATGAVQTGQAQQRANLLAGADLDRGVQALQDYGCITCHTIPGVPGANSLVGPPLNDWAGRGFIAGMLPNNPDNLMFWIQFPQEVQPGNVMPNMGVGDSDARDIAAYLYTLEPNRSWWGNIFGAGRSGVGLAAPSSHESEFNTGIRGD
jgi:cytochrome c